ncbi:MAG: low molecular weight phosphotyrosine protein phosphatase [Flavobacteriales bacterium TMED84]|nr:MAG: low molecular weight phosphotyrosine protein phosphatase [Flavobacteriales bacterium TMED84]|tara:strand:+ start:4327 stop:4776 length:450 start_codon:yes stop_codon:yes gene_type:complete
MKILMVCLGNICRSPLAEGILSSKISKMKVTIDSAGTAGYHVGSKPDPRAIDIAKKNNIDISTLRARKFERSDFINFDKIYVMDKNNFNDVIGLAENKNEASKVILITDILDSDSFVPDPYYGDLDDFEKVFNLLDKICQKIANKIESR